MLLNDRIQIPFTNTGTTTVKAGQAVIIGQRTTYHRGVFGVAVADVEPGASGLLETSGIFSLDDTTVTNVRQYQQVYCYHNAGTNEVTFSLTLKDAYVYAGISLTDRAANGGPLILALGYNNPVYTESASTPSSAPPEEKAGAMNDTPTMVDPPNTSGPGVM